MRRNSEISLYHFYFLDPKLAQEDTSPCLAPCEQMRRKDGPSSRAGRPGAQMPWPTKGAAFRDSARAFCGIISIVPERLGAYIRLMAREHTINAEWDTNAGVWVATSEDVPGLVTESKTISALEKKLCSLVPELLRLSDATSHAISVRHTPPVTGPAEGLKVTIAVDIADLPEQRTNGSRLKDMPTKVKTPNLVVPRYPPKSKRRNDIRARRDRRPS